MGKYIFSRNIVWEDVFIYKCRYWNRLEGYCRELTQRYAEVRIISGPLFLPERDESTGKSFVRYEVSSSELHTIAYVPRVTAAVFCNFHILQVIGENGVAVPTHLFKIILAEGKGKQSAMGVFIIPNKPIDNVDLTHFQVSLETLEAYTGTTFHLQLDRSKVYT